VREPALRGGAARDPAHLAHDALGPAPGADRRRRRRPRRRRQRAHVSPDGGGRGARAGRPRARHVGPAVALARSPRERARRARGPLGHPPPRAAGRLAREAARRPLRAQRRARPPGPPLSAAAPERGVPLHDQPGVPGGALRADRSANPGSLVARRRVVPAGAAGRPGPRRPAASGCGRFPAGSSATCSRPSGPRAHPASRRAPGERTGPTRPRRGARGLRTRLDPAARARAGGPSPGEGLRRRGRRSERRHPAEHGRTDHRRYPAGRPA
jgi:hypothetical protein